MPHMFLPIDGLKAVYKFLPPQELMSIGSSANPIVRKLAITALFEQHTQEAMYFQQRLLHYWAQHPGPYMPDEKTIRNALAFYSPKEQLAGHFIYAQQKASAPLTFSDAEFQTALQAVDKLEFSEGLIAVSSLTQNAMMLTNTQRATLLGKLTEKYTPNTPATLSQLAPYMAEGELKTAIDFLIKQASNNHIEPIIQSIQILGSYLKQTIPGLSSIIFNIILQRNFPWEHCVSLLCSIIPISPPEDCLSILNYLKTPPRNQLGHCRDYGNYLEFLMHSCSLVQKLMPNLDAELLMAYIAPLISIALEKEDEEVLLFLKTIVQYMSAQQLKPVLDQLLPYLQQLIPPHTHHVVSLSNLLFNPLGLGHLNPLQLLIQSDLNEYQCTIALQLLQTAASNANPEQLTSIFELLHKGLNYLNNNIHHEILKTFPILVMRLGTRRLTESELNKILAVKFVACHWEEQNIKSLNELLACLPLPQRVQGVTYLLKNHVFNSPRDLRFLNKRKTLASIAQYVTVEHQTFLLEPGSQTHNPKMHLDLMRLLSPFHAILSSQQITQLLTIALINLSHKDYDYQESALETLHAIHYKVNAKQKTLIPLALQLHWDKLPFEPKQQVLIRLYPGLLEEERRINIEPILSTARYLKELLTLINQIRDSIPKEKIFYTLSQILKYIKPERDVYLLGPHSTGEEHQLIQALFSTLAPQMEKGQQTCLRESILKHCEKTQQCDNLEEDEEKHYNKCKASNNIAFLAPNMIPSLTHSLNSQERLALFEKLNTPIFQQFLSPTLLFPIFLNLSHPKNADIEPLPSLEEEHQSYINYLVSFINTPNKISAFQVIRLDYCATPQHALTALNTWMLQCLQEQPESLEIIHQVIQDTQKEENTKEFYLLQQLVKFYCIKSCPTKETLETTSMALN